MIREESDAKVKCKRKCIVVQRESRTTTITRLVSLEHDQQELMQRIRTFKNVRTVKNRQKIGLVPSQHNDAVTTDREEQPKIDALGVIVKTEAREEGCKRDTNELQNKRKGVAREEKGKQEAGRKKKKKEEAQEKKCVARDPHSPTMSVT